MKTITWLPPVIRMEFFFLPLLLQVTDHYYKANHGLGMDKYRDIWTAFIEQYLPFKTPKGAVMLVVSS